MKESSPRPIKRRRSALPKGCSLYKVRALKQRAELLSCFAPSAFWKTPVRVLAVCYNGIGPDQWSPAFRRLVTRLLAPFEVSALIHDYEYVCAPRSYGAFSTANWRFFCNAFLEGAERRRFVMVLEGALLALLCQFFGWHAFREAENE